MWRRWYQYLAGYTKLTDWRFMNYGYAPLDADEPSLELAAEDEPNRYPIDIQRATLELPATSVRAERYALAAWVSHEDAQGVLQSVGGWLPDNKAP